MFRTSRRQVSDWSPKNYLLKKNADLVADLVSDKRDIMEFGLKQTDSFSAVILQCISSANHVTNVSQL